MHAKGIVDAMLGNCLSSLHAKLGESVKAAVCGALVGGRLSLSQLARSVDSQTAMRYRIKRIDRLLGNKALHRERATIYHEVAAQWLTGIDHLLVVVDWSDATTDQQWHLLRASVSVEGRSMTLYEEVHPQRKYGDRDVHRRFLAQLGNLLPAGCEPIIMTDAGFRSTWFDLVTKRGWQWVGAHPRKRYGQHCGRRMETMFGCLPRGHFACTSVRQCALRPQSSDELSASVGQTRSERTHSSYSHGETLLFPYLAQSCTRQPRAMVVSVFTGACSSNSGCDRFSLRAENANRAIVPRYQE
ncbi:MAG: hypothetical protein WA056_13295 [Gallionella sp.]